MLNETPDHVIPEQTRQRVLAAASKLGYTPSPAARALAKGHSDVVLLLLPDWPIGPTIGGLLENLSAALSDHGLTFVAHPRSAGRAVSQVWKAITPAAVITFEELDDTETTTLQAAGISLTVTLFGGRRKTGTMDVPEQRTGRLQAEHLAAAGHRHLGYAWPNDPRVNTFAEARLEGVRQTCADLGLAEPHVLTVPVHPDGATAAVRAWQDAEPAVTGICGYNDEVALAVLGAARRNGYDVPRDLAVIGADNIAVAAVTVPTLTTVQHDTAAFSRYIADTITRKLNGRPKPRWPSADMHWVIRREST